MRNRQLNSSGSTNAPSYSTVKKWVAEFKRGKEDVTDESRAGRPVDVVTDEQSEAVHRALMSDRKVTIRELAKTQGISIGSIQTILSEVLHMKKFSARWVLRMLTEDQKKTRVNVSRKLLSLYQQDTEGFLARIITQDKIWVHHFDPETKKQSMQWKHIGSPPPRKFKKCSSTGNVMASIFWNTEGILLIDYLEKGHTINGEYYANSLTRLREAVKDKSIRKLRKGILLLQDNAPVHTAKIAVEAAKRCSFRILPHPPYSPDLAPSDFYLFPKLKEELRESSTQMILKSLKLLRSI